MKIYLDMDGVLVDFNKEYERMFGARPEEGWRRHKHFWQNWDAFVESHAFVRLGKQRDADELLQYVEQLKLPVEILSSSGGEKYHEEVTQQKITWLCNNSIPYKANIVPGGSKKAEFAQPWHILVDDTEHVVDNFRKAGGTAILHTSSADTIKKLSALYLEWQGGQ